MFSAITILFSTVSVLIASTIHEFAHAYTAHKLGDLTPKINGRLTLNPLAHIDPIGALSLLILRFGWSKPVPINSYNFKNPKWGTALTAIAGPVSNIAVAFITGKLVFLIIPALAPVNSGELSINIGLFLYNFIYINCALAIFNLIPIPPLDGSKILFAIIPVKFRYYWRQIEKYGIYILLILILPFSPLSSITTSLLSNTITTLVKFIFF